jgi:hypothetical protein
MFPPFYWQRFGVLRSEVLTSSGNPAFIAAAHRHRTACAGRAKRKIHIG